MRDFLITVTGCLTESLNIRNAKTIPKMFILLAVNTLIHEYQVYLYLSNSYRN